MITAFPNGVSSFGIPCMGPLPYFPNKNGLVLFVDGANGLDGNDGKSPETAKKTIQAAVDLAGSGRGDVIYVFPKGANAGYAETVTIARGDNNITLIGVGPRGSVFIDPSTEDAGGMVVRGNDVTLINMGVAAEDDTSGNIALLVTGARFRAYGCKIEGGDEQVRIGPTTVALGAASGVETGADAIFYDCEIAWGAKGIVINRTDYGAVTQLHVNRCRFHNLTAAHMDERNGTGGQADTCYRNLEIVDCFSDDSEGGTAPTNYFLLNDNNGNDGIVTRCSFPTAINSGLNLVSTALHWVCNYHTGGVSTGQPS